MHTVINKIWPEWNNFNEVSANYNSNENEFVKSINTIAERSDQKIYKIVDMEILLNKINEIAESLKNANETNTYVNSDLKALTTIYDRFQPKKLDKFRYDAAYKRAAKQSDNIKEMYEKRKVGIYEPIPEDPDKPKEGSAQDKYEIDFDIYQKTFVQNVAKALSEIGSSRMRAYHKISQIGSEIVNKAPPIEINYAQSDEDLKQEMKKLNRVVRKNKKMLDKEFAVDEIDEDDFCIVKEQKGIVDISDDEEEEAEGPTNASSTDHNIKNLAQMMLHANTQNPDNNNSGNKQKKGRRNRHGKRRNHF